MLQTHTAFSNFSTSQQGIFTRRVARRTFLTVHSCNKNLPLISYMYAYKFQRRLTLLGLISVTGVKHLPALSAKNFSDDPQFFARFR